MKPIWCERVDWICPGLPLLALISTRDVKLRILDYFLLTNRNIAGYTMSDFQANLRIEPNSVEINSFLLIIRNEWVLKFSGKRPYTRYIGQ